MPSSNYSLARAIAALADRGSSRAPVDGVEGAMAAEIARRSGRGPRGLHIPAAAFLPAERRALTTSTGTGAVGAITPGASLVDALRPRSVVGSLGARFGDLRPDGHGKLSIPRVSAATTVHWVAEGSAPDLENAEYDAVVLTPKTIASRTAVSRRLLKEAFADPRFDDVIAAEIARGIAVEIDRVAVAGTGASNMPTGVLYADGVDVQAIGADGGAPTRDLLLAMEAAVGAANGDAGADARIGWATSPAGRKKLRSVDGSTGTAGAWLWSDDNKVLGSPAVASANVPANLAKGSGTGLSALISGDWSQLFVNLFSGADVLVDPFKQNTDGYIYVNVFVDVDVAVLNPAAFSVVKDMATS